MASLDKNRYGASLMEYSDGVGHKMISLKDSATLRKVGMLLSTKYFARCICVP